MRYIHILSIGSYTYGMQGIASACQFYIFNLSEFLHIDYRHASSYYIYVGTLLGKEISNEHITAVLADYGRFRFSQHTYCADNFSCK